MKTAFLTICLLASFSALACPRLEDSASYLEQTYKRHKLALKDQIAELLYSITPENRDEVMAKVYPLQYEHKAFETALSEIIYCRYTDKPGYTPPRCPSTQQEASNEINTLTREIESLNVQLSKYSQEMNSENIYEYSENIVSITEQTSVMYYNLSYFRTCRY